MLTYTDPLGNTTTNAYDNNGNLLSVTSPAPNGTTAASVTQFAYNSLGELTQITDPLGHVSTLTYTPVGLISTITDAQQNVTTYQYDSHGNRTAIIDALQNTTSFAYDAMDRVTTITYPGGSTAGFGYGAHGRRISVTDQDGPQQQVHRLTDQMHPRFGWSTARAYSRSEEYSLERRSTIAVRSLKNRSARDVGRLCVGFWSQDLLDIFSTGSKVVRRAGSGDRQLSRPYIAQL